MFDFIFRLLKTKKDDMTFWEHADILRRHIIQAVFAVLLFSVIAFFYKRFIFDTVILAPSQSSFITYRVLCKLSGLLNVPDLCIKVIPLQLINTEIGGQFSYHILVSVIVGIIFAFPFIVYQFWRFLKPALTAKEIKYSRGIVFYISSLFIIGVLFGYYLISPLTICFLASYELSPLIKNYITINSYISTISVLSFSMGLVFELPVLVFFLSKIGLLTTAFLKKQRKIAIVAILLIAGFITPSTDMFTQLVVSLPLYMLYELSINISKRS